MKRAFILSCFFFLVDLFSFAQAPKAIAPRDGTKPAAKASTANPYSNVKLTYKIISSADSTYGYDIYADGKLMLHQPSRPAMAGNKGFASKAIAEKVAAFVMQKIKRNEMPPTVTKEELKKLDPSLH